MVPGASDGLTAPGAPASLGFRVALVALLVLACALRTAQYLGGVSLWHDELALALNIEQKGFRELLTEPLAHRQVAPVGFLAAVALASRLAGVNEAGLRLVPWLFGLAAVFLFWRVGARVATGEALLAGLTLFAFSPALILYAATVKPYSADVAIALLLVCFALRHRERPDDLRRGVIAGALGGTAQLFSHPAVLVAVLIAAILAGHWLRVRPRPPGRPLACLVGGWSVGAAVAAAAALLVRDPTTLDFMHEFWGSRGGFPPPLSDGPAALAWAPRQVFSVFAHFLLFVPLPPLVAAVAAPAAALAVLGLGRVCRSDPFLAVLSAAPILAGLSGAFAGVLPFRHRVGLYAGSAVLVFTLAGLQALKAWPGPRSRWVGRAVATAVAAPLAVTVLLAARPPYPTQESRPVLQELARRRGPGDLLYVYCGGRHAIEFYGRRVGVGGWTQGGCHASPRELLREVDAFRGAPRVWLFFTQSHPEETVVLRSYLRAIGRERDAVVDPAGYRGENETAAYLFDLSDGSRWDAATADSFVASGLDEPGSERSSSSGR